MLRIDYTLFFAQLSTPLFTFSMINFFGGASHDSLR